MTKLVWPLVASAWGEEERQACHAVIDSGHYTCGARVKAFEAAFAAKIGAKHAVMVNSGSSANLLAFAALLQAGRIQPGAEVIVPAVAWSTTYAPLYQLDFKLRFVDVNLHTLNIDVEQLGLYDRPSAKAMLGAPKMLVAVNILGNPCDLEALRGWCDKRGVILVEDNCESIGATIGTKQAGTFGLFGTYSFFYTHHISTMEGGMIVTDDEPLAHVMRCMRGYGWTRDLPDDTTIYVKGPNAFEESYRFLMPGFNLKPLEIQAAAGLVQLDKLDAIIAQRRKNADTFRKIFQNDERFILQRAGTAKGHSSWFNFTMIAQDGERAKYLAAMDQAGIEYRQITGGNILRHDCGRLYYGNADTPNADRVHRDGWFVGNHPVDLTEQIKALREAFKGL